MPGKLFVSLALAGLLGGCSLNVESTGAIHYFAEADLASATPDCAKTPEDNWKVETFDSGNLEHTFVGPLGLICARDGIGALVKAYRSESNKTSTHRLVEGTTFGVIPRVRFEVRDAQARWSSPDGLGSEG